MTSASAAEKLPVADEAAIEFFEKEVRPILVARCFECHSGGEKAVKGGLRLDSRDAVLKGGDTGPAVVLDAPASSLLLSSINYGDVYQMPPKSKLPANEIAVLTKWIERGIPWSPESASAAETKKGFDLAARAKEHWCWQPIAATAPPAVKQSDWPQADLDRFILAKLEASGLKPAPQAERGVLLRRIYFDLIGLPPTPEELQQFLQDSSATAVETVVDRLLNSVHFGERWARHWMDLVRYAETRGHEFDHAIPNAWQYRDYVIRALNADVPYDRFLTEHIAGDLIEPRWRTASAQTPSPDLPKNEGILGTGFWFLGEEVHSPVDIRKDETDRVDNRLDVFSKTFLGVTLACSRCHDHKFDAISQRDYYSLAGYIISSGYRQIRVDTFEQHQRIARQLDEYRTRSKNELAQAIIQNAQPVLKDADRYWIAARQVLETSLATFDSLAPGQQLPPETVELVNRVAKENAIDNTILNRWCVELSSAGRDSKHPFHKMIKIIQSASGDAPTGGSPSGETPIAGLVVDFGDPNFEQPIQDGVSFGLRPIKRGSFTIDGTAESPKLGVATIGGWQRDLFWKNLQLSPGSQVDVGPLGTWQMPGRMVRSPEFDLKAKRLWYLIRGSVRAYATVNSHLIVDGPLHGSLLQTFKQNDDEWRWVAHGLDLYTGHRMHVEFAPVDDGPCSIAMIVQSDEQPKLPEPTWNGIQQLVGQSKTVSDRATAVKVILQAATQSLLSASNGTSLSSESDLSNVSSQFTPNELSAVADWFVKHQELFTNTPIDRPSTEYFQREAELAKEVRWDSSLAPAILDGNGVDEHLLIRGNSITPKETVPRQFLEAVRFLSNPSSANPEKDSVSVSGSGRLALAHEILRSPLAARVAVNRIWHHLFGRGIVPSVDNFGVLGLPPSHPELLDYLATQFTKTGWSTKGLIRSLVLSKTYQMSSHPTDAEEADPNNELWHRMPIKRLEGEAIRDSILLVSGSLDRTSFGPSVPVHLTEFMQGRGRPKQSGPLDGNSRRSLYIAVRRNFLSPMMLAYDTPNPFSTVGRRTVSNVPAQALILMNDPFVVAQANRWAERLLSNASQTTEQRIDQMYLTAFARHPSSAEITDAIAFLQSQGLSDAESQREAWSNLCHVLFNVKEFVFVE